MNNLKNAQQMRRLLDQWSDNWQAEASRFAESHRDLMPRRITNSQLFGLVDKVRGAEQFHDVTAFLENQATKAERTGRYDVQEFWRQLKGQLSQLKTELKNLLKELPEQDNKKDKERLLILLAGEYVRHLLAQSLFFGVER